MPVDALTTIHISLPDSELAAVLPHGATLGLRLAVAQARQAAPGSPVLTGYLPGVLLTLHGARLTLGEGTELADGVGTVHEGRLCLNGQPLPAWLPLPSQWTGELVLQLALRNRASLSITARSCSLTAPDAAGFRESLAC